MTSILRYREVEAGEAVKGGTKLRILPVGDSITVGFLSDSNGGDGDGYRGRLEDDLSGKSLASVLGRPLTIYQVMKWYLLALNHPVRWTTDTT